MRKFLLSLLFFSSTVFASGADRTVIIGDSITLGMFDEGSFPSYYIQLASGGSTVRQYHKDIPYALNFLYGPIYRPQIRNVVVYMGSNDLIVGVSATEFNTVYRALLNGIKIPGVSIFCVGLHNQVKPTAEFNAIIKAACPGTYISLAELNIPTKADGIHLPTRSARTVAQHIMKAL